MIAAYYGGSKIPPAGFHRLSISFQLVDIYKRCRPEVLLFTTSFMNSIDLVFVS
jgi:hypothetical protein